MFQGFVLLMNVFLSAVLCYYDFHGSKIIMFLSRVKYFKGKYVLIFYISQFQRTTV